MKPIRPAYRRALATAAVLAVAAPAAVHLLHAQVIRCYVEICVDKGDGQGQSCIEKPIPCPEQLAPTP